VDSPLLRKLLIATCGAGLALILYGLFFWSSDEDLILERLDDLTTAIAVTDGNTNPALKAIKLKGDFQEIFTLAVAVDIPELPGSQLSRGELAKGAAGLAARFKQVSVGLSDVSVQIQGDSASVQSQATLTAIAFGGEARRDVRDVSFELVKEDGEWRIQSVVVGQSTGSLF